MERVLSVLLAMQRRSWEQGLAGQALLDLGRDDLALAVAADAVRNSSAAGLLASAEESGAVNGAAATEVVAWAAARAEGAGAAGALRSAVDRQLAWLLTACPRAQDGTLFHLLGSRQVWVDTVFMVVPALAAAGHLDRAREQLAGHRRRLFDEGSGLWSWRWDEDAGALTAPQAWGTGNGWVVAALARTLHRLGPGAGSFADDAAAHVQQVAGACLAHRRADGVFGDVVDDPSSFSEANLAQMLAYALLTGVADGWLGPSWRDVGRDLLDAARARVDEHGVVTGVVGAPLFDRPGASAEAQCFHLLAVAAEARSGAR